VQNIGAGAEEDKLGKDHVEIEKGILDLSLPSRIQTV
jgi:hypothetical protein